MVCRILSMYVLMVMVGPPSFAEIDQFAVMQDFSRCAALYDHAADLGEKAGKPASAEGFRGAARGARLAAEVSAMMIDMPEDGASDADWKAYSANSAMRSEQVASLYSLELNRQRALYESGEVDSDGMQRCIDLNPLQTTIVEQVRRSGYFSITE